MNAFVNAASELATATATANLSEGTGSRALDLFRKVGAVRGTNLSSEFRALLIESEDLALRLALYTRDVRGGVGERQHLRDFLKVILANRPKILVETDFLSKVVEVGRWDDILSLLNHTHIDYRDAMKSSIVSSVIVRLIRSALERGDGLCAKWMPRKGPIAAFLTRALGLTPKQYRKKLVGLTEVVESKMCAGAWDEIEYRKVPSRAMTIYRNAFNEHDPLRFSQFKTAAAKGEVKVNAAAVYPYQVTAMVDHEPELADAMWNNLPDYLGGKNVLPMVDVSGSMTCLIPQQSHLMAIDVAISLGMYCAMKGKGAFKDLFLTFSWNPEFVKLASNSVSANYRQMERAAWGMSTDFDKALRMILNVAVKAKAPQSDLPDFLMVFSDMQFNGAGGTTNANAYANTRAAFERAGYKAPTIVFWNLVDYGQEAASANDAGVVLLSGFSPASMKAALAGDFKNITPFTAMIQCLYSDRYKVSKLG